MLRIEMNLFNTTLYKLDYTLSHLENDRDVSAYSGERHLSSCAQLVCVSHAFKKELDHKGCILQRVFLDAISDVTVVLGMRQSIVHVLLKILIILFSVLIGGALENR